MKRVNYSNPKTEVSELRENWQESVHPNEIFINLDNLVMADRRYKEIPNRVYMDLEPTLTEQVQGKGKFSGVMMQEIQPKQRSIELGGGFRKVRIMSLIAGNLLKLIAATLVFSIPMVFNSIYSDIKSNINPGSASSAQAELTLESVAERFAEFADGIASELDAQGSAAIVEGVVLTEQATNTVNQINGYIESIINILLAYLLVNAFARCFANIAHLFFAEIQFESDLIYMSMEGTFTESKISTGSGIHDSTRSENTLVRSSITPWVISTRVISSIFAASGMKNLEYPRFIMELHRNDEVLASIRSDLLGFLKDRESIASITSERDLRNASQIHSINQNTRAVPMQGENRTSSIAHDEEAAGYLREESSREQHSEQASVSDPVFSESEIQANLDIVKQNPSAFKEALLSEFSEVQGYAEFVEKFNSDPITYAEKYMRNLRIDTDVGSLFPQ